MNRVQDLTNDQKQWRSFICTRCGQMACFRKRCGVDDLEISWFPPANKLVPATSFFWGAVEISEDYGIMMMIDCCITILLCYILLHITYV